MFKRPSFAYSLLVSIPLTIFFGAVAIFLWPLDFIFFFSRMKKGGLAPIGTWVKFYWSYWMFRTHGLEVRLHGPGKDKLQEFKGCVFVSNHQSSVDILAHIVSLPRTISFVAKKELLYVPIFGLSAKIAGTVFIDRSKGTREDSLKNATTRLHQGLPILLYPEGTRSSDGKLLPFKRGAFVMAIQAGVPIVPLTILNSRFLCPKGQLSIAPGVIDMVIDEPIETKDLKLEDRYELSDQIYKQMAKNLDQFHQNRENQGSDSKT